MARVKSFQLIILTFLIVVLASCANSTSYQPIIGQPVMLNNRSILVMQIEGVPEGKSIANYKVLNEQLSATFNKVLYLPAQEYELAKNGIITERDDEIYNNLQTRKTLAELLDIHYLLKIELNRLESDLQNQMGGVRDKVVYTFSIYDIHQPTPSAKFNIVVKTAPESVYMNPETGFSYAVVPPDKAKMAMTRACKEITSVAVTP